MTEQRVLGDYAKLKHLCERVVVRWHWGTLHLYDLRPHYIERWGFSPPKALRRPPTKPERAREYGLDAEGRVAVIRKPTKFEGQMGEHFFVYGDDWVEEFIFTHFDKQHATIRSYQYADGRLVSCEQRSARSVSTERYEYDGARCVKVVHSNPGEPDRVFQMSFHEDGSLAMVTHPGKERAVVIYESPEPDLDDMATRMVKMLVERVPPHLKRLQIADEVYCLGLVYSDDYYLLPPELGCGSESLRRQWLADEGEAAAEVIWSPEDWTHYGGDQWALHEEPMVALGRAIGRHLQQQGDISLGIDILVRAAKQLQKIDWAEILRITDDFVVVPVSVDAGLTAEGLKAVPASLKKRLRKTGAVAITD